MNFQVQYQQLLICKLSIDEQSIDCLDYYCLWILLELSEYHTIHIKRIQQMRKPIFQFEVSIQTRSGLLLMSSIPKVLLHHLLVIFGLIYSKEQLLISYQCHELNTLLRQLIHSVYRRELYQKYWFHSIWIWFDEFLIDHVNRNFPQFQLSLLPSSL